MRRRLNEQAAGLAAESPHLQERVSATRKCEQGGVSRAVVLAEAVVCTELQRIESYCVTFYFAINYWTKRFLSSILLK